MRHSCKCGGGSRRDCSCGRARDASPRSRKIERASSKNWRPGVVRMSDRGVPFKVCAHGIQIQALLFPRGRYTPAAARAWAKKRGFRPIKIETTTNFVRVRLHDPGKFVPGGFRLVPFAKYDKHAVRALYGCPKTGKIAARKKLHGRPIAVTMKRAPRKRLGR